jgi:hypothetical protein
MQIGQLLIVPGKTCVIITCGFTANNKPFTTLQYLTDNKIETNHEPYISLLCLAC